MLQVSSDNPLADVFNNVINILTTDGEDAAKAYILTTPLAWMEGPGVDLITNGIIDWFGNKLDILVAQRADKIAFEIQTGSEDSAVKSTYAAYQAAKQSGDANAQNDAFNKFAAAAAALAHSDGTSNNMPS